MGRPTSRFIGERRYNSSSWKYKTVIKMPWQFPEGEAAKRLLIIRYKRHAKTRNYNWSLSREEVEFLIGQNCFYCGSKPSNIQKTKNTITPLAYNGITCCKICNRAKSTMSFDDFIKWCQAMAEQWG